MEKIFELLPYLLQTHCTRGTSKNDPRIRMSNDVAIPLLAQSYADHYNNAGLGEHWNNEEVEETELSLILQKDKILKEG